LSQKSPTSPKDFFPSLVDSKLIKELTSNINHVWEILPRIKEFIKENVGKNQDIEGNVHPQAYVSNRPLRIKKGAVIEPGAYVLGPAYIGPDVVVRNGAYVRENVILMKGSLLGHASEVKNSLFFPGAHAPHFNYVGDSILGMNANLGAGTKLSNLTLVSEKDLKTGIRPTIKIKINETEYDTGLAKLGAILGDRAQTGCNSVLNPGCLIGPRTIVYANLSLRKGYYPPDSIIKLRQTTEITKLK
jgi:NDP-sugar pyrophosphorylase family protein